MKNYKSIINKFSNKKILVVGDLILDQYIKGSVSRISPEAPVPVILQKESFYTPGGAANVAHNLRELGAKVTLVGKIGNDADGKTLCDVLRKKKINTKGIFIDRKMPTVTKTRVIAQHQQVCRIDQEKVGVEDKQTTNKIFKYIENNLKSYDGIIISDYGKGLITPDLVRFIVALAVDLKKIITVDPKVEHFSYYRHVTSITPNLKEAENAIRNIKVTSDLSTQLNVNVENLKTEAQITKAGQELVRCLELESILITLGERGMRLFEKGKKPLAIKTKAQDVFDVSGAGDAVISIFTLAMTAGATKGEAADLSNFGAGIVVGKMGAVAVSKDELIAAVKGA